MLSLGHTQTPKPRPYHRMNRRATERRGAAGARVRIAHACTPARASHRPRLRRAGGRAGGRDSPTTATHSAVAARTRPAVSAAGGVAWTLQQQEEVLLAQGRPALRIASAPLTDLYA